MCYGLVFVSPQNSYVKALALGWHLEVGTLGDN